MENLIDMAIDISSSYPVICAGVNLDLWNLLTRINNAVTVVARYSCSCSSYSTNSTNSRTSSTGSSSGSDEGGSTEISIETEDY